MTIEAMSRSTRAATMYEIGRISRGKYTLVTSWACDTSPFVALVSEVEKKVQGSSAA